MIESKSELKVVIVALVLIGAPLLGVDIQALVGILIQVFGDPETVKALEDIRTTTAELARSHEKISLSGFVAGISAVYAAGRTVYKGIKRWADVKESQNEKGRIE